MSREVLTPRTHRIDVPAPSPATPADVRPSEGDASGVTVTTRAIHRADAAVFPVSGEMHYSRIPRARWAEVLRAARAGGLTHVATYVLWNHHEPQRGEVDFTGDLDLRAFALEVQRAGLGLILRIGPYAHAEARHGGLPDWLADSGLPLRTNDPDYLAVVDAWYAQLAVEVAGIPLLSVQVDNELYDGAAHLERLREMAEAHGIGAPIWTATAWGGAQVPAGALPVYGGYPESFWVDADAGPDLRSFSNFYPSPRRDDDSIGADHRGGGVVSVRDAVEPYPFATCELGGGMASAYHRRLDVPASDVSALALAKLASGSVWQGYYMYADGRNPRRHLQESHETGAPNDFVELAYDFGAPVQVDGAVRPSWFALRRQHLLLERWGAALAEMPASFPVGAVDSPDVTGLRWSVRSDGRCGFVFVVNRQPGVDLPAHDGVAFEVSGLAVFPAVDIPSGAAFAWPFGLPVGDATITWMTAQPITELVWRELPLLVAAETAGIPAALDADADVLEVESVGRGRLVELSREGMVVARVLVLAEADADAVAVVDGTLVWAPGGVAASDGTVTFAGTDSAEVETLTDAGWRAVSVAASAGGEAVTWTIEREAGAAPSAVAGASGRASVPLDWSDAAVAQVAVAPDDDRTLTLDWRGDVARAWDGDRLVADALWTGRPWRIPADARAGASSLRIEILPGPPAAAVHFPGERPVGAGIAAARLEGRAAARVG
ncbi:beta-galactosidase [Microbacterium dauci]|uniref:Beta-galactosidase n=1 Tax=Microbacterium dauci TaxID=3048008 RepID=A0ABT6ZDN2_9MICO|nr:beta-galactosidase [Microbacterium sp. LX3-4]MDJ1114276.1 beta-galactosidase [Microbacterium sp. LX3-4]